MSAVNSHSIWEIRKNEKNLISIHMVLWGTLILLPYITNNIHIIKLIPIFLSVFSWNSLIVFYKINLICIFSFSRVFLINKRLFSI